MVVVLILCWQTMTCFSVSSLMCIVPHISYLEISHTQRPPHHAQHVRMSTDTRPASTVPSRCRLKERETVWMVSYLRLCSLGVAVVGLLLCSGGGWIIKDHLDTRHHLRKAI